MIKCTLLLGSLMMTSISLAQDSAPEKQEKKSFFQRRAEKARAVKDHNFLVNEATLKKRNNLQENEATEEIQAQEDNDSHLKE